VAIRITDPGFGSGSGFGSRDTDTDPYRDLDVPWRTLLDLRMNILRLKQYCIGIILLIICFYLFSYLVYFVYYRQAYV